MSGRPDNSAATASESVHGDSESYDREFWSSQHGKFVEPHYRLKKTARIVTKLAQGKDCTLLDIGCGPGTLGRVLPPNIRYYGTDIAIARPAPNMREADLRNEPIQFGDERFDIVVAQGVFEYLGDAQSRKLAEIAEILAGSGRFLVTYWNFSHRKTNMYEAFSNVQPFTDFRQDLARYFTIDRFFPASHNWKHTGPNRRLTRALNMPMNLYVPVISPLLAVEYFLLCSPR
jgi:cyclopropane fatty-acyl-phospholipid synthase-like methyltransferase